MRWLVVHIGGQKWSVYLVSGKSKKLRDDNGEYLSGQCFYSECKIYVAKDLDEQAREEGCLHEFLHALLHVTSAEKAYGCDVAKDEELVSKLTPALHRLLKDLGFKFPSL